jgi:putative heme iron utilization protein
MAVNQERDFVAEAGALIRSARSGSLATVNGAAPHVALVTPAPAVDGSLILLLSTLSAHTRHLQVHPACALLIVGAPSTENPQTAPRVTLTCQAAITASAADRTAYLHHHPYAALYADFADFDFWRLTLAEAHYVGGFAAASALNILALQHEIMPANTAAGG